MITPKAIPYFTLTEPQICSGSKSVPFLSKHLLLYLPQQSMRLQLCAPNPGSESEVSHRTAFLMPVRVGTGTLLLESSIRGRGSRWKPRGSDGQRKWWLRWEPEKFFGFVLFFFKFYYLFICGCAWSSLPHGHFSSSSEWGLLSSCCVWASHFSVFFCSWAQALGLQASVAAARAQQLQL